jgi:phosphatidylserine synthase
MFDAWLRPLIDIPLGLVATVLAPVISANKITLLGFGFGMAAMACISLGHLEKGFWCFLINRLCDGFDGAVARKQEGGEGHCYKSTIRV